MGRVTNQLTTRGLSLQVAAREIGVGVATLKGHLSGEHVRSDSARKYENWLAGKVEGRKIFVLPVQLSEDHDESADDFHLAPPEARHLVVDIFSGCGGLSLGFDVLGEGKYFRTILAIDNQAAPISVLNRNAKIVSGLDSEIGRQVDLTEFANEAEFLAFYVQHAATTLADQSLLRGLNKLSNGAFPDFLKAVAAVDLRFRAELDQARASSEWRKALSGLDKQSLNQTSVIGFHEKLKLPKPSLKAGMVVPVLWASSEDAVEEGSVCKPAKEFLQQAMWEWEQEEFALAEKQKASGKGQLSASARRVSVFVSFLRSDAMLAVKAAWINWRAARLTLRSKIFDNPEFARDLRNLYTANCKVSVLVGGPPCQGFSRIGRGKIRSLRDARVQVHGNAEAGDSRNLLFLQYVMVLGALRPEVFLFENVQHFQSTVKADGVEFEATEVLAEAIANISGGEVSYEVSSRVIDASRHGIPQTRQRFFMAGVQGRSAPEAAQDCLTLRRLPEATLNMALTGLSEPVMVGGDVTGNQAIKTLTPVSGLATHHPFLSWVRQRMPRTHEEPRYIDGHAARAARADDAAFFALMGPGKRWMDYRADDAATITELQSVLDLLLGLPTASLDAIGISERPGRPINRNELAELRQKINGSLPLRLLLEQVGTKLGAPHHLLAEGYLSKRDGNHGDWVARMDASRPAKTMVSHMAKDTYAYVHPASARTISVREAARVQTFPDWFSLADAALTDAFKMIGNAVPPMLSHALATRVAKILQDRVKNATPLKQSLKEASG